MRRRALVALVLTTPRRSRGRAGVTLCASLAACSHPDYGAAALSRADSSAAARPALDATTSDPASDEPPLADASIEPSPLTFEEVVGALAQLCDEQPPALDKSLACRQAAMTAELERLFALDAGDAPRQSFSWHQAEWARYADAACWLAEESFWMDFDAGTRGDDTNRGVAWITCKGSAFSERLYFARALANGEAASLAHWAESSAERGEIARKNVAKMRGQVDHLISRDAASRGDGDASAGPHDAGIDAARRPADHTFNIHALDADEKKRFAAKLLVVQFAPGALARASCKLWPELSNAFGGEPACREKFELYYFAQAQYGKTY